MQQTSDFSDYEPTAHDPGWARTTVIVVIVNVLITCTLPLLLWAKKRKYCFWKQPTTAAATKIDDGNTTSKIKKKEKVNDDEIIIFETEGSNHNNNRTMKTTSTTMKTFPNGASSVVMSHNSRKERSGGGFGGGVLSMSNPGSVMSSTTKTGGRGGGPHNTKSPASASVISSDGYSTFDDGSTMSQQIARNVLLVRAHRNKQNTPIMPKDAVQQQQQRSSPTKIAAGAETTTVTTTSPSPRGRGDVNVNVVDDIDYYDDIRSVSILSGLDNDAVSIQDAVDGDVEDEAAAGGGYFAEIDNGDNDDYDDGTMKSKFYKLIEIADWDSEMKSLWSLTVPYSIQGISNGIFDMVEVALIGHFLGTMEANAVIIVGLLIEFTTTFTYGFSEAVGTLCPQADGAKNPVLMGRYVQLGMLFYLLGSIPGIVLWSFLTERAVLWFGFDLETAQLAQAYAYPYLASQVIWGLDNFFLEYYNVIDHEKYCTLYDIARPAANALGVLLMVLLGYDDLVVIGVLHAFLSFLFLAGNFSLGKYLGWLDSCWEGLVMSLSFRDRRAVHTMLVMAIPLGISWILTYGEWEVMTIFISSMGAAEVAAWGLVGYLWSSFEEITEGIASAANVRVAFRLGAGRPKAAKICAYKSMYLSVIISVSVTSILFILSPYIPGWITPDPTLQRMVFDIIPIMGFGQIIMSVGSVSWYIIGAQGRMRLATGIEIVSSWFLAIPISAILIYTFNLNLLGPTTALVCAYSVGCVATGFVVLSSDWKTLSQKVAAYSAKLGVNYDEYDWADLPSHVQRAAESLGYDKKAWNTGADTPTCNIEWSNLTANQQSSARLLGYTQQQWDDSSDENDSDSDTSSSEGEGGGRKSGNIKGSRKEDDAGATENLEIDEMSWDQLPLPAQKAAGVLGIDREMWNADEEPESGNKYWKELTPAEQEAAKVLGYTEARWDVESESDDDS